MRRLAMVAMLVAVGGCNLPDRAPVPARRAVAESPFDARGMRLHPTFTRLHDISAAGRPTTVEVELEFVDGMNDPVKAQGRVVFELYAFRADFPDPRGTRITNPFVGALLTAEDQKERWNPITRTYSFKLLASELTNERSYVLTATFEPTTGGRLFSRLVLRPVKPPSTPTTSPG